MAEKKTARKTASLSAQASPLGKQLPSVQQPPAEDKYADQLAFLRAVDTSLRPRGWLLSPERVVDFVCGTQGEAIRAPAAADLPPDAPSRW